MVDRVLPALGLDLDHGRDASVLLHLDWAAGAPPAYAVAADRFLGVELGLDANDRFGDCGPTSCDNHRRITTKALVGTQQSASLDEVFDLYRRSGNPGFDPATGADDNGVSMPVLLGALRSGGLGGHKAVAYARLRDTSDASVYAAIDLFGAVLFAVSLQEAQQNQTDTTPPLWDYVSSPDWGGHAVVAASYDSRTGEVGVGSWGMRVLTTANFRARQLLEVWVPIWPETLGSHRFHDEVDVTGLAAQFKALTGGDLPVPVSPPAPDPVAPLSVSVAGAAAERIARAAHHHGVTPQAWVQEHFEHYFNLNPAKV